MVLHAGDRVRVIRGDMSGRIGVIRRALRVGIYGGQTYGVEFPGERPLSNFRASNIEAAGIQEAIPEFLQINNVVRRLTGKEPYELITGGLMGKRRRYWWMEGEEAPNFTVPNFVDTGPDMTAHDFRRFPIERDGVVVTGLWSCFQPHPEQIAYVLLLLTAPTGP